MLFCSPRLFIAAPHARCIQKPISNRKVATTRCGSFLFALLTALCLTPFADAAGQPEPREISAAERQAAELVIHYMHEGARSWWPFLAQDSPYRQLGEEAAAAEIAVRLGPPEGSHYQLRTILVAAGEAPRLQAVVSVEMPSGLDDTLEFLFTKNGEQLQLFQLRSSVDPRSATGAVGDLFASGSISNDISQPPAQDSPLLSAALMLLAVAAFTALIVAPRWRRRCLPLYGALAMSWVLACDRGAVEPAPDGATSGMVIEEGVLESLAGLQDLRNAIAGSTDLDIEQLAELVPDSLSPEARKASRVWRAQALMAHGRLAPAEKILSVLPSPSTRPLVELLRARLALLQGKAGELIERYDRALIQAPDADHLRLESIYALATMGRDDPARVRIALLLSMGTRSAEGWYLGTALAILDEHIEEAERRFRIAFDLQPITRKELFGNPLLSYIATRPASFSLFNFGSSEEPHIRPEQEPAAPLEIRAEAEARSLGSRLEVAIGNSRLTMHGAASILPASAQVESASEASERETANALSRLDELTAASRAGGLTHPARQRQAKLVATALALDRRWDELIRLTDNSDSQTIDPDLIKLRSRALLEVERDVEGKNLLIQLAKNNLDNRRQDPGTLYQLAEMFVHTDEYDLALKLINKANSMSPQKVSPQRIRQIKMDRELAASFQTFKSKHFTLRYPSSTGEKYPRELSQVLEAEWRRLQRWIPVKGQQHVEIHLFDLKDFMAAYSGGVTVLGIYDGKVRVPLADLKSFDPVLVNILSHEVAHAMIDLATDGHAPKWFHEGLASHIEMDQKGINPIPDMHAADRDLSFAIIEPVLAGFSEPQLVGLAYSHATWALHYVESKHGIRGIHKLLASFRQGRATPEALNKALGMSIAQFDDAMRTWCLTKAPAIWPTELVRYDRQFDALIERERPTGPPPKVAMPAVSKDPEADLRSWHDGYTRAVAPVKASLGQTLALLKGQKQGDLKAACQQLAGRLRPVVNDRKVFESPNENLTKNLKSAYRHMTAATRACLDDNRPAMEGALRRATQELGKANKHLAPYELRP